MPPDPRTERYGRAIAGAINEDYMEDWRQYDRQAQAVLKLVDAEIAAIKDAGAASSRDPDLCPACDRIFKQGGTCPKGGCPMGGDF